MASLAAPPEFEHTYARSLPSLAASWAADISSQPQLVIANPKLAIDLGIDADWLASNEALHLFSGNGTAKDVERYALAYAGHQFGSYSPRLGDGRALLIGEFSDPKGQKWDLHLKGSGRTPFARGGDGKATLGPMLREFLMGEAMATGAVPVTNGVTAIPEFADDSVGVLAPGEDAEAMAAGVIEMLEDADLFMDRSKAARARVVEQCGPEATTRREIELFDRLRA